MAVGAWRICVWEFRVIGLNTYSIFDIDPLLISYSVTRVQPYEGMSRQRGRGVTLVYGVQLISCIVYAARAAVESD